LLAKNVAQLCGTAVTNLRQPSGEGEEMSCRRGARLDCDAADRALDSTGWPVPACGTATKAMERAMSNKRAELMALTVFALAACALLATTAAATAPAVQHGSGHIMLRSAAGAAAPPLMIAQNPFSSFTLSQMPEPPVSPVNPGTLPGTTTAAGVTGTNPITGLPCNGAGSISVSGAGGLPGSTSSPPPGTIETLGNIPVGTQPFNSIYGSQSSLGAC
jgi:hypothetical protein